MIAAPILQHHLNGLVLLDYSAGDHTIGVWHGLYAPAPSHPCPRVSHACPVRGRGVDHRGDFSECPPSGISWVPHHYQLARRIPLCYPSEAGVAVCRQLGRFVLHEPRPWDRDHGAFSLPLVALGRAGDGSAECPTCPASKGATVYSLTALSKEAVQRLDAQAEATARSAPPPPPPVSRLTIASLTGDLLLSLDHRRLRVQWLRLGGGYQ